MRVRVAPPDSLLYRLKFYLVFNLSCSLTHSPAFEAAHVEVSIEPAREPSSPNVTEP